MSRKYNFAMSAERVGHRRLRYISVLVALYYGNYSIQCLGRDLNYKILHDHLSLQVSFVAFNYNELVSAIFMKFRYRSEGRSQMA